MRMKRSHKGRSPEKRPANRRNRDSEDSRSRGEHRWTFLSNHAHVLICLARDPRARLRDVSEQIGITERAVQGIVADLEAEGLLRRDREGRRNVYELHLDQPLRHPIEMHRDVGELIDLILEDEEGE